MIRNRKKYTGQIGAPCLLLLKEVLYDIQQTGRTILLSTHLIEYAERLCDHVCIIDGGRKIVDGPIERVKREHGGAYVALTLDGGGGGDTSATLEKLEAMTSVTRISADGNDLEVALEDDAGSNDFLASLVSSGIRLRRFAHVEPSLQQIFIERVVGTQLRPRSAPPSVDPETGTRADV